MKVFKDFFKLSDEFPESSKKYFLHISELARVTFGGLLHNVNPNADSLSAKTCEKVKFYGLCGL